MTSVLRYAIALIGAAFGAAAFMLFYLVQPWSLDTPLQEIPVLQYANLFLLIFIVAIAHAFLLGLPAGLFIKKLNCVSAQSAALGGLLIGAVPITLWLVLAQPPDYSSTGGVVTAIDGVRMADGWWDIVRGSGISGASGIIGGLCAWTVWIRLTPAARNA